MADEQQQKISEAMRLLVRRRWDKKTAEERSEIMRKVAQHRRKKKDSKLSTRKKQK